MMEPDNPRLDDYILGLARGRESRVCYVPTATGDNDRMISNFYRLLGSRCRASHLPLFMSDVMPARERLEVDVIYVAGGSTANMLAIWRLHGIDELLRSAYERGVILCGLSAGALCWFEQGVTDSFGALRGMECLGFLAGSFCRTTTATRIAVRCITACCRTVCPPVGPPAMAPRSTSSTASSRAALRRTRTPGPSPFSFATASSKSSRWR
jgi:peptidase E